LQLSESINQPVIQTIAKSISQAIRNIVLIFQPVNEQARASDKFIALTIRVITP